MMILAEVSSGRSDLASASPTNDERPGSAAALDRLDRRRAAGAGGRKGGGADGDDQLGIGRLHGLDRIAGVDRSLERVGRDDLGDVGDLHDVEQRGDARQDVLRIGARRGDDRAHSRRRGRRSARRAVRRGHARRARRRRPARARRRRAARRPRRRPPTLCPATSTSTGRAQLQRGGQRPRGDVAKMAVGDFGEKQRRHVRSLPLRRAVWRPAPRPS